MCDAIYISNTHETDKKIMDGNFSDVQRIFKMDKNQTQFKQSFKYTTPHMDLRKFMAFKVVKQINMIG